MFRAILPEGQIDCEHYDHIENGIELYDDDDEFIAFIPYANLHAIADQDLYTSSRGDEERSIM